MKIFNAKKVMVVTTCGLVLATGSLGSTLKAVANVGVQEQQAKGKKLICKEMGDLNTLLEPFVMSVVFMKKAYGTTSAVLKEIQASGRKDKAFITEKIKSIIEPVAQFFGHIHMVSGTVKPVVEESLLAKGTGIDRSNCQLLKFLDASDSADVFFDKNINTIDDLIKFCQEYRIFFQDIEASLSDAVSKPYKAIIAKLQNSHKQSAPRK